jgi:NitT/TauT family transport system ATP-binding protein
MTARTAGTTRLTIGFIPLADAAALIVAADRGFAVEEGLELELVREVSWSNVRDKLNIGLFDAAHLLAPLAIASSLGIGHIRAPLTVPFSLALNGNAITVSPALWAALSTAVEGDLASPAVSARALASLVAARKARRLPPLTWA